jgi:hypothetical protein
LSINFFEASRRLEQGDAVLPAASQVVDGGEPRVLVERHHCGTDVVGVDVVPNLLALVAEDSVRAPFSDRTREVREESVELGTGVVRTR